MDALIITDKSLYFRCLPLQEQCISGFPIAGAFKLVDFSLRSCEISGVSKVNILNEEDTRKCDHCGVLIKTYADLKHLDDCKDISFQDRLGYMVDELKGNDILFLDGHIAKTLDLRGLMNLHSIENSDVSILHFDRCPVKYSPFIAKRRAVLKALGDPKCISFEYFYRQILEERPKVLEGNSEGLIRIDSIEKYFAYNLMTTTASELELPKKSSSRVCLAPVHFWGNEEISSDGFKAKGKAINSIICNGSKVDGATIEKSVLSSEISVHKYSTIQNCIIFSNVSISKNCHLKNCIIDSNAILPEGIKIGYDLEQDKEQFTVIPLENGSWLTLVDRKKFDKSNCCSRGDRC